MASKTVEAQMDKILAEFADEEMDAIESQFESAGELALTTVKELSPRGHGKYADGWTLQKTGKHAKGSFIGGNVSVTVYNKTKYRLTHLLNNGHVIANQYGRYDRWEGDNHIGRSEERAERLLMQSLKEKL